MSVRDPAARDLDAYAHDYHELPFESVATAIRRRTILERVEHWAPRRLLEIGCGDAPLFTDLPGVDVVVVEPAAAFSETARRLALDHPSARVHRALIEDVDPRDLGAPFDLVVVSSLLHEVPEPTAVLHRAVACCRPGGVVHINVPNATSLHRRLGAAMALIAHLADVTATGAALSQHSVFDAAALHALVRRCGLDVVAHGGMLVKPFSHQQMAAALDAGVIDEAVLHGLDELAASEPALASEIWVDARINGG